MKWICKAFSRESSRYLLLSLCLVAVWLSLIGSKSLSAAEAPDLLLLRDAICAWETRNVADPDAAVGRAGEFGRCQISYNTARQLGFRGHPAMLFIREINEEYALKKLSWCGMPSVDNSGRIVHTGFKTLAGLAWCFNGGKWRGPLPKKAEWPEYVREVMKLYKQRKLIALKG